jgi:hypothetical protein
MQYKGVVNTQAALEAYYTTNNTSPKAGDTFRVGATFDLDDSNKVEAGDMLICLNDATSFNDATWQIVQTNISGAVTDTINGDEYTRYSNDAAGYTIYAPTTAGTTDQLVIVGANGLTYTDQSNLKAGELYKSDASASFAADELLSAFAITPDTDGTISGSITVGGHTIATDSVSVTAAKVVNGLTLGDGLEFNNEKTSYDGSEARTIKLSPATATTIGGVIIDKNGSTEEDTAGGKTITVDADGNIYITK